MALSHMLQNKTVYFDTNIFIYLLEGSAVFTRPISDIKNLIKNGRIRVFSSSLVYTELLPPHAKQKNQQGIDAMVPISE